MENIRTHFVKSIGAMLSVLLISILGSGGAQAAKLDLNCGCNPGTTVGAKCYCFVPDTTFEMKKLGTREFRFWCDQAPADQAHRVDPWPKVFDIEKSITCLPNVAFPSNDKWYVSKTCTNWNAFAKAQISFTLDCIYHHETDKVGPK